MGLVGVDEAGKGPVLGSMFAAAVRVREEGDLPETVRDSKALTADRREMLATGLRSDDRIGIGVAEVPVARIDAPETDMNTLTAGAHAAALTRIAEPGDRAVLDAADVRPGRFADRVAGRLDQAIEITAFHGADEEQSVVAAASIVAKVERDAHVDELAATYGTVGSGYPSDPETRAFLEDFVDDAGRLPACARASWRTAAAVLADAEQAGLGDY